MGTFSGPRDPPSLGCANLLELKLSFFLELGAGAAKDTLMLKWERVSVEGKKWLDQMIIPILVCFSRSMQVHIWKELGLCLDGLALITLVIGFIPLKPLLFELVMRRGPWQRFCFVESWLGRELDSQFGLVSLVFESNTIREIHSPILPHVCQSGSEWLSSGAWVWSRSRGAEKWTVACLFKGPRGFGGFFAVHVFLINYGMLLWKRAVTSLRRDVLGWEVVVAYK